MVERINWMADNPRRALNKVVVSWSIICTAGNHNHQHAVWAMGREQMATSLGIMVTHMQQITNGGWKATSLGTMVTHMQQITNGGWKATSLGTRT